MLLDGIRKSFDIRFAQGMVIERLRVFQSRPREQGGAGNGRFEEAMQIRAENLTIDGDSAVMTVR